MSDLETRIKAYGGDYEAALDRFMGDEDFYLQMLDMLAKDTSVTRLDEALKSHDLSAAFSAAHELKGVAGNLGLTPLFQALDAMVEPLRTSTEQDYSALMQDVRDAYDAACSLRSDS